MDVKGPQTGWGFPSSIVQVVEENRPYGNQKNGLALHLSFARCLEKLRALERFKTFARFDDFDYLPLSDIPCYDLKLGTDVPAALKMLAAVLHQVYEYSECTAFSCEVWVCWTEKPVQGGNDRNARRWLTTYRQQIKQKRLDLIRDNYIRDLTDPSMDVEVQCSAAKHVAENGDEKCRSALAYLITDPGTEQELVEACIIALAYSEHDQCKETLRIIIQDRRIEYKLRRLCATKLGKAVHIDQIVNNEPERLAMLITLHDLRDCEKVALKYVTRIRKVKITERLQEGLDGLVKLGLAYTSRDMYLPWTRLTAAGERLRQELLTNNKTSVPNPHAWQ